MPAPQVLANYHQAKRALAVCVRVDEAKAIRDKAEALRAYAVQASDHELETWAAEVKVRAQRRIGELSKELEKAPGPGRGKKKSDRRTSFTKAEALKAAKLTKQQAHRCEQVAAIPEEEFEAVIEEKKARKQSVSAKELISRVRKTDKTKKRKAAAPAAGPGTVADLRTLVAGGTRFGCVYADPPWGYDNQGTRASTGNHYETMTADELAALPVGDLAAPESHLWLWTTNAFLFECPRLFAAWGFEFKASYVWVKPQIGIGNYLRNAHEFLLLAVRGGLTGLATGVRSWGEFDRAAHSAKPERIRSEVVEAVSPGPRLELFGRRVVPGWTVWGDQVSRDDLGTDAA